MFYEASKQYEQSRHWHEDEDRADASRREQFSIRVERPEYPEARTFHPPTVLHRRRHALSAGLTEQWAGKEPNAGALIMNAILMLVVVVGGVVALGSLGAALLPLAIEKLGTLGVVVTGFVLFFLGLFVLSTLGKLLRKHAKLLD